MILHKMQLDEANTLEFGLQVFGTEESVSETRFVIEGKDYSISFKCDPTEDGVAVNIPKMKGLLPAGVYESKLEVIIDGKIFTPLSESVEFEPLIEFGIAKKETKAIKEGVSVSLKNATPRFEDSRKSNYQLAEADGFEIVKVNNFEVLKKDDKYYGFVSEKAYLKHDKGYGTVTELMESI